MRISVHGANTVTLRDPRQCWQDPARRLRAEESSRTVLIAAVIMRRFRELISVAALRKTPATVAVIQVDGVIDIEQLISVDISERIMRGALFRLLPLCEPERGGPWRYLGQLGDNLLLLVLATADRAVDRECVTEACDNLRQPMSVGDAVFQLTPYAVSRSSAGMPPRRRRCCVMRAPRRPKRAAHARAKPCFYADASELTTTAPLDIAHDLKDAIANGEVRLRYVPRHDLASGRLVAWVGYLRWRHRVYGEIQPDRDAAPRGGDGSVRRAVASGPEMPARGLPGADAQHGCSEFGCRSVLRDNTCSTPDSSATSNAFSPRARCLRNGSSCGSRSRPRSRAHPLISIPWRNAGCNSSSTRSGVAWTSRSTGWAARRCERCCSTAAG